MFIKSENTRIGVRGIEMSPTQTLTLVTENYLRFSQSYALTVFELLIRPIPMATRNGVLRLFVKDFRCIYVCVSECIFNDLV